MRTIQRRCTLHAVWRGSHLNFSDAVIYVIVPIWPVRSGTNFWVPMTRNAHRSDGVMPKLAKLEAESDFNLSSLVSVTRSQASDFHR